MIKIGLPLNVRTVYVFFIRFMDTNSMLRVRADAGDAHISILWHCERGKNSLVCKLSKKKDPK